ncbi:unnamed protein product [Lathyrus sativus]|nr:unnamed protein product [Lathyrus sativus]
MIMEKKPSKGRSFLTFFDWNGKSQKKLFVDVANQAKENIEISPLPMSQIKMDENVESPSSIACSDFSFALSITSDDSQECETSSNSPGLVARLMGLDSLPPVSTLSHEIALHSLKDYCHVDSINMVLKSNRMSLVGPLSPSLRAPELRDKSERESGFNVNGKPTERRRNLYKAASTYKDSRDSGNSSSPHGKGKSVSLTTTQSKTNVLSKDTLNLKGNRTCVKEKEIKSNRKNCIGRNSDVLRPNGLTSKGKSTTKVRDNRPRRTCSSESSTGVRKTANKCAVSSNIESKRSSTRVADKQKEFSVSKRKNSSSPKKRCDQNDNAVKSYERKSVKCNVTTDERICNYSFSMNESKDVISFTFTSPLRRNMPESRSTTEQAMETMTGIDVDALSVMLSHINPPQCTFEVEDCSVGFKSISEDGFNSVMELEYVKDILSSAELMTEELAVDETENMIMPTLFDTLENQRTEVESYEEYSKLQRKAIFDCVSECLGLKCRQVFVAKCKTWPRWVTFMRRRWLTEEVYKEILELRSMEEEVVVDEIVRKDMCTPMGRWLDFDIEVFENGLEIELGIVTFLIDELVSDLWLV